MGSRHAIRLSVFGLALLIAACGPKPPGNGDDGDDAAIDANTNGTIDASHRPDASPAPDALNAYPDATPYDDGGTCSDWVCTNPVDPGCGPTELCGTGGTGDGNDDNCD